MIGTSRQDGFMHYRNVVCLLSCSLFLSSAWGFYIEWRTMQFRCLTLVASDIQLCQPGDKRE
ncbi:hypothetical protein EC780_00995 [Escherichia coli]|nr:hypothetical protein EC725_00995 [Escherichia coli]ARA00226.1 hypothetical protein EC780_00995 [Escherichia coli]TIZ17865.1 hypothetical protein C9336_19230 [Escherichia coli]